MAEKIKGFFRLLDIPSGAVLGVYSGAIVVLSVWATLTKHDLPGGVVTAYLGVVAAKTGHSVMTKEKSIEGPPSTVIG